MRGTTATSYAGRLVSELRGRSPPAGLLPLRRCRGDRHRDTSIRDCAPGGDRFFTGDATRTDGGFLVGSSCTRRGTALFGLADEYCCDGGYFQADPFPNVYEEPDDCEDDVAGLQSWDIKVGDPPRTDSSCREFEETVENWFDPDWSVSDVENNHLMDDNLKPRGADRRRHEWLFGECGKAGRDAGLPDESVMTMRSIFISGGPPRHLRGGNRVSGVAGPRGSGAVSFARAS